MKIGIIGAGRIGGGLGTGWIAAGHEVMFGVRNQDDADTKALVGKLGARARIGSAAQAADFGEVIAFAIPGNAMQAALTELGDLGGKVLIDATNGLSTPAKAGVQMIAEWTPGAHVYKAFNSVGFEILGAPQFGATRADMLFCGADGDSRHQVETLIADMGFNPIYVGDLSNGPLVEMLARLWGSLAYGQRMGRRLAFKILTPQDE
ncbi:MAG: NAD(P)-binding domain-containing protein [Chloroflexota bacterium]|nr:NAD(P)-binding domain-containing protein [Chloroflexota bacterium]